MSKKSHESSRENSVVRIVNECDSDREDIDLTVEIRPAKKSRLLIRIVPEEPEEAESVDTDELPF